MTEVVQRSLAQVQRMKAEEINRALKAGELSELLAGRDPGDDAPPIEKAEQVTREQLKTMSSTEIVQAHNEGRLADLMGGE